MTLGRFCKLPLHKVSKLLPHDLQPYVYMAESIWYLVRNVGGEFTLLWPWTASMLVWHFGFAITSCIVSECLRGPSELSSRVSGRVRQVCVCASVDVYRVRRVRRISGDGWKPNRKFSPGSCRPPQDTQWVARQGSTGPL